MRTFKSRALVCRTMKYGESSIIADLYTRERGMRSFIINGVRIKKGRSTASYYQLMTILDVVAYDRTDGKLARLKEVQLAYHYLQLPYDVVRSSIGTFMLEVSRQCLISGEEHEVLFDFLLDQYLYIDHTEAALANVPLSFLLRLSVYLGFAPDSSYSDGEYFDLMEGRFTTSPISAYYLEPPLAQLIHLLLYHEPADVEISARDRATLLKSLIDYYRLHIESFKPLKSLPILKEIL